jgi:hypothetical protein
MVGNRVGGLVYPYVGVVAAEDALVLDLVGLFIQKLSTKEPATVSRLSKGQML